MSTLNIWLATKCWQYYFFYFHENRFLVGKVLIWSDNTVPRFCLKAGLNHRCQPYISKCTSCIWNMLFICWIYSFVHIDQSDLAYVCYISCSGPDVAAGHQLQVMIPGGCWKHTQLLDDDPRYARFTGEAAFCLLSEAVAPGFDYRDLETDKDGAIRAVVANQ